MVHTKRVEEILNQILHSPLAGPSDTATVTKEQLVKIAQRAYALGLEDTYSVLRRTELGSTGQMIAQALEALLSSYQETTR